MKFTPGTIAGSYLIEVDRRVDDRGYFGRLWCEREMAEHKLSTRIAQVNVGVSKQRGTLRGMHLQTAPNAEVKIIRVNRGAAFDVIVDMRADSPTYLRWFGVELNATNGNMLYAPEGCAHGYITLCDDTELSYTTSQFYAPKSATGARYNDPAFGIAWPIEAQIISDQDKNWPLVVAQ